ncbi:MAG TPA: hypothetical protein PK087_05345, partial [Bacilli bacterium]|nr:hypothetical protein [Bacilli bacterium]
EVDYQESIDRVIALLDEKLINLKDTFPQILEGPNVIGVIKVLRKGFIIRIIIKTMPETHYSVEREVQKQVKELFEQNNIRLATEHLVIDREQTDQLS